MLRGVMQLLNPTARPEPWSLLEPKEQAGCHAAWFRCRRGGEAVVSGEQPCARALTAEPS